MRQRRLWITGCVLVTLSLLGVNRAQAQVSYSVLDSLYTQDFDSLPNTPQNASLGTSPLGWTDDNAAPAAGNFSIPGWYVWHPATLTPEGGANNHQRMRAGAGTANTGSFYSFGTSGSTDRALGSLGSATVGGAGTNMYMGVRLVNNTSQTLDHFSVAFDGEQWRTFGSGTRETLSFAYSLAASPTTWNLAETEFTTVPALNYTATVGGASAGSVDGNNLGRVARNGTITGINWAPGTELWLRWSDVIGSAATQDGLGVDNFRFSTAEIPGGGGLPEVTSVMTGLASNPATWSNNQAPTSGNVYRVLDTHTVTVDYTATGGGNPFPGNVLRVNGGGVAHFNTSGVHVPLIIVESGGNVTESVSGDFALGDIFAPNLGSLQTVADLGFNIDADSEFFLDMAVQGPGNIDFNSGDNAVLWLSAAGGHSGRIRFNGSGDQVRLTEKESFGTLEMNSTGDNVLFHSPSVSVGTGVLIFNQPGTIDHAAIANRLHGVNTLEANATVNVDLSKGFPDNTNRTDERRYQVATGMRGASDVNVNGTTTDFSTLTGVSLNEFEVGGTGEPTNVSTSTYSGTLTGTNFVNIEIRQHFRDARFVVGNNARLEMGHQALASTHSIEMGEIVVNNGGILEVGFEQSSGLGEAGHHIYQLTLTESGTRDGSLTLNTGGTLRMQVNGTGPDQFDTILADGNVQLGGTLNVLVNPGASNGTSGTAANVLLTPSIGQTFDIIKLAPGPGPAGDYDASGTVDDADYALWRARFGTNDPATDGNANGVVDAADYVVWRKNFGATGGGIDSTITGTFSNIVVTDFNSSMGGLGFKVNYLPTVVQLEVVAAGVGALSAVPEPATLLLVGLLLPLLATRRRSRA